MNENKQNSFNPRYLLRAWLSDGKQTSLGHIPPHSPQLTPHRATAESQRKRPAGGSQTALNYPHANLRGGIEEPLGHFAEWSACLVYCDSFFTFASLKSFAPCELLDVA